MFSPKSREQKAGLTVYEATVKTLPVDADYVGVSDSAAGFILKKTTWAVIKSTLKTYFDTFYAGIGAVVWGGITGTLSNQTDLQAALNAKVTGPASSTDNAVVRFDSTTGKLVQNSPFATFSDNGSLSISGQGGEYPIRVFTADGLTPLFSIENTNGNTIFAGLIGTSAGVRVLAFGAYVGVLSGNRFVFNNGNIKAYSSANAEVLNIADALITAAVDVAVPDEVYGAGWNASLEVPTKNAVYDKIESLPITDSGFYTPASSNETNINSNTPTPAQWMRVGDVVTVSGRFAIDIAADSVDTLFELDLPIASVIANDYYVAGVAYDAGGPTTGGDIYGNTGNDTAQFKIMVPATGALITSFSYTYTYRIA